MTRRAEPSGRRTGALAAVQRRAGPRLLTRANACDNPPTPGASPRSCEGAATMLGFGKRDDGTPADRADPGALPVRDAAAARAARRRRPAARAQLPQGRDRLRRGRGRPGALRRAERARAHLPAGRSRRRAHRRIRARRAVRRAGAARRRAAHGAGARGGGLPLAALARSDFNGLVETHGAIASKIALQLARDLGKKLVNKFVTSDTRPL